MIRVKQRHPIQFFSKAVFLFFLAALAFLSVVPLGTQEKGKNKKNVLNIGEMLRLVLKNNADVILKKLELAKADTALRKDNSAYAPSLEGGWQKQITKKRYTNSFTTGDTVERSKVYLKAKKLFSTGTYFEAEIADSRIGSEQIDSPFSSPNSATPFPSNIFSPSTLHTSELSIVLRQELLKNAFGVNQRRRTQMKRNEGHIRRQELIYTLFSLAVQSMVDFWRLSIVEENIRGARRLLQNTRNVRSITIRKRRLGLAESFEINQWNAFLFAAETRLAQAKLEESSIQRDLARALNFKREKVLKMTIRLVRKLPANTNPKKDTETAYTNRSDLIALEFRKKNAEKSVETAFNQLLPSISIGAKYTAQGFDPAYGNALEQSLKSTYPDYGIDFKVEYPLWDEGLKADARNAKLNLAQLEIQVKQLRLQIKDEVYQAAEQMKTTHKSMLNSQKVLKDNRSFYTGLLRRYRQGRFSANAVKNALDTLVQSEQAFTEALVNFNISIARYEFVTTMLFTKYGIDLNKVLQ